METYKIAPGPPYFAVIFSAELTGEQSDAYRIMGQQLLALAKQQPGFLGYDDFGAGDRHSFNISYWERLEDIQAWKEHAAHLPAQARGKETWYQWYEVKIARVERAYSFDSGTSL